MKQYAAVLLDIDGTLLDTRDQVSPNTRKLLSRLEARGVPVVLCSSRPPAGIAMAARAAGVSGTPAVCYNGSLILDERSSLLADTGIDRETALRFKRYAAAAFPQIAATSYLYDIWLVDSVREPYVRMVIDRYGYDALEGRLEDAVPPGKHVHKMMCMGAPLDLRRFQEEAAVRFPDLRLAASGASFLEVTAAGVSKGTALEVIRRHYGLEPGDVVAVGDYYVDVEMLQRAGLGIAMGNAPEAVKRAAARVTASNDEEGLYIALKNLRFRPPDRVRQAGDSRA